MIQRVQTLFLLGAIAFLGFLETKKFPFASLLHGLTPNDAHHTEYNDSVYTISDNSILMFLSAFILTILIGSIFLFKNRKRQVALVTLANIFLGLFTLGAAYLPKAAASHLMNETNGATPEIQTNPIPYAFLILALALSGLAIFYIRKDEKLVRSADRLR